MLISRLCDGDTVRAQAALAASFAGGEKTGSVASIYRAGTAANSAAGVEESVFSERKPLILIESEGPGLL